MHPTYKKVAGIDVHKKLLYVVIAGEVGGKPEMVRARFDASHSDMERLSQWLEAEQVETVVMESTAMYWRPVWLALEGKFQLLLANARSNEAPRGRKRDYADAERLTRRLVSGDLRLSFVPEAEQRDWRELTRTRVNNMGDRIRLRNRIEVLLEQARIKLSSLLSDLFGVSGLRMLRALADGETDTEKLVSLGASGLRASKQQLAEALRGELRPPQRLLLTQYLDRLEQLDRHNEMISEALRKLLQAHQPVLARLCTIPGVGITAAEQIVAEVGPAAATFASASQLCSWVGTCPGRNESAGKSTSDASPKGNRWMRRLLVQCAWAAVRTKGSFFESLFARWRSKLGVQKAIWAISNKLLRIIWRILHLGDTYKEFGPVGQDLSTLQRRLRRISKLLEVHGYVVELRPQS